MAVYIDEQRTYHGGPVIRGRRRNWCHLGTDGDLDELHEFARRLGMKRAWFQGEGGRFPHYDLVMSRRKLAIRLGAIPLRSGAFVKACKVPMPAGREVLGNE